MVYSRIKTMENIFTYQNSEQEYPSFQNPLFQYKEKVSSFLGGVGQEGGISILLGKVHYLYN